MGSFSDLTLDSAHDYVEGNVLDRLSAYTLFAKAAKTMRRGSGTIRTHVRTSGPLSKGAIEPRGTYGVGEVDQETKLTWPLVCLYSTASMSKIEAERMGGFGSEGNSLIYSSRVKSMSEDMEEQLESAIFAAGEASATLHEGLRTFCDNGTFATTWGGKTRATETTLKSNVVEQAGVSLAESDLANVLDPCWSKGADPTDLVGLCDQPTYTLIKGLYWDRISFNRMENTPSLHAGWRKVMYVDETPIIMSTKALSATLFVVDMRHWWIEENPNIRFKVWEDPQPNSDAAIMRTSYDSAMCGDKAKTSGRLYSIA